ncbi:MAG: hypothetical protein R2681_05935 [Pyrinomonadaceae bacterium]
MNLFLTALIWGLTISCQNGFVESAVETNTPRIGSSGETATQKKSSDDLVFTREGWIYHLPALEKTPRKIVKGSSPTFDRERNEIIYVKPQLPQADAESVLMIHALKTGKSRELFREKGFVNYLEYDPKGDLVLFVLRTPQGKTKLEVLNSTGKETFTVIETNKEINDVFAPVWSADGDTIFFHDMTNLFHVSLTGQILKKTPLEKFTGSRGSVTSSDRFLPSPTDDNSFVFTQLVPGTKLFEQTFGEPNTALFLYDLTKNKKKRLTPENMFAVDPVWSSDGATIYFTGYYDINGREDYPFRIFSIKKDGTGITPIATGEGPKL